MAKEVTDADEVAGALGELGRETVPKVVSADLGGAIGLEAGSDGGFAERGAAIRDYCFDVLGSPKGSFKLTAKVLAVRGRVAP